jgi:hypothetical protein
MRDSESDSESRDDSESVEDLELTDEFELVDDLQLTNEEVLTVVDGFADTAGSGERTGTLTRTGRGSGGNTEASCSAACCGVRTARFCAAIAARAALSCLSRCCSRSPACWMMEFCAARLAASFWESRRADRQASARRPTMISGL